MGQWWTNTEMVTDENGEAYIEGFCGDYKLTCLDDQIDLALCQGKLNGVKTIVL
jgi:hypothetical protein